MSIVNQTQQVQGYASASGLLGDADRIRKSVLSRFSPLDGIGQDLRAVKSYAEALALSGLGFKPIVKLMVTADVGKPIVGYKALFNEENQLSVVKKEYTVVSNEEAFAIAEDLVNYEGFTYEVSNLVNFGARSRLVLAGPKVLIEGEEFTPYAVFNNSFDLSKSVSVQIMFLRLLSMTGYMRRGPHFDSAVTFTHFGNKEPKLKKLNQFKSAFAKTVGYLQAEAAQLKAITLTREQFIDEIIPIAVSHAFQRPKDALITERQQTRTIAFAETLLMAYDADDLTPHGGTAYKAVLAMADVDSHAAPFVNRSNPDLYINRVLQDGLRPSLANTIANHFISTRP